MCTEVVVDDHWLQTCGELAERLGCCPADFIAYYPGDLEPEDCLCSVDVEQTALRFGYRAVQDWKTGCGEWVLSKL